MEVVFLRSFIQDFKSIEDPSIRRRIERAVKHIQAVGSLREIAHLKKLEGSKNAFRVRVGDHRIGFFLSGNKIELARVLNRHNIYRSFP